MPQDPPAQTAGDEKFRRYPPTSNRSLQVMSAADELLLEWASDRVAHTHDPLVIHDRFGALALSLPRPVRFLASFHSQEEALRRNAVGVALPPVVTVFDPLVGVERALIRVPKSMELWEVYLATVAAAATPETEVAAGFMTRHFTPRLLEIAGRFAHNVKQSPARKKARLLLLSGFLASAPGGPPPVRQMLKTLEFGGRNYRQYYGVFSADHIDYATQWLLQQWEMLPGLRELTPRAILDLACGNGIIGNELLLRYPDAELTASDDAVVAVESARLNLPAERARVLYDHTLMAVPEGSQDLVVTNPPFHFGHENNIEISLGLFRQARRALQPRGYLVVVANRHLNYAPHLGKMYGEIKVLATGHKFVIYRCRP